MCVAVCVDSSLRPMLQRVLQRVLQCVLQRMLQCVQQCVLQYVLQCVLQYVLYYQHDGSLPKQTRLWWWLRLVGSFKL